MAGRTYKGTFPVDANGDYTGEVAPGTYTIVFRAPGMPPDKKVDYIDNVQVVAGQDILQDVDMSRKEFIDASAGGPEKSSWKRSRRKTPRP